MIESNENRHGLRSPNAQISRAGAGGRDERVVGGDPVRPVGRRRRVDAQELAEQGLEVVAVAFGIAARPAVADADVEHPVRADAGSPPLWFSYG